MQISTVLLIIPRCDYMERFQPGLKLSPCNRASYFAMTSLHDRAELSARLTQPGLKTLHACMALDSMEKVGHVDKRLKKNSIFLAIQILLCKVAQLQRTH